MGCKDSELSVVVTSRYFPSTRSCKLEHNRGPLIVSRSTQAPHGETIETCYFMLSMNRSTRCRRQRKERHRE
jgi:hypothetical protein